MNHQFIHVLCYRAEGNVAEPNFTSCNIYETGIVKHILYDAYFNFPYLNANTLMLRLKHKYTFLLYTQLLFPALRPVLLEDVHVHMWNKELDPIHNYFSHLLETITVTKCVEQIFRL